LFKWIKLLLSVLQGHNRELCILPATHAESGRKGKAKIWISAPSYPIIFTFLPLFLDFLTPKARISFLFLYFCAHKS